MPRQRSLVTVIRDMVGQEVHAAIQSLLGSVSRHGEADERSAPEAPREMAPWWSRSSAKGGCREDGAEAGPPSSQASAWSWAGSGLEDQGGVDDDGTRSLDAVGDPHPEGASPPAQAALRDARHLRDGLRGKGD